MHDGPVVVFSGGGTGGHLYPALAIADALRDRRPDVRAVFVGAERGLEARILPSRGEEHLLLPVRGLDRARPWGNWRAVAGLAVGLFRVARLFTRVHPEVVVVTGGYAAAAAGIGAGLMGIPLILQEQNSLPGVVTRFLTRWACRVHVAFPEAIERLPVTTAQVLLTGNPVRPLSATSRQVARRAFGVPADVSLALVVGGSQGSAALNGVMLELVESIAEGTIELPETLHFLWATGSQHYDRIFAAVKRAGAPPSVHVFSYFEDMPSALVAADVAVSRAGAMSTAELLNQGLPALLVPLPTAADDHQTHNARALARAGAAVIVPESELTAAKLVTRLAHLISDPDGLDLMRRRARERARPDAAAEIAADVASFLSEPRRTP